MREWVCLEEEDEVVFFPFSFGFLLKMDDGGLIDDEGEEI